MYSLFSAKEPLGVSQPISWTYNKQSDMWLRALFCREQTPLTGCANLKFAMIARWCPKIWWWIISHTFWQTDITMENHCFHEKTRYTWPFSIVMWVYQRVTNRYSPKTKMIKIGVSHLQTNPYDMESPNLHPKRHAEKRQLLPSLFRFLSEGLYHRFPEFFLLSGSWTLSHNVGPRR